jgi:penicillin-binding protein 2
MWLPDLPGIMPEVGEVRNYPLGAAQAHIIGYVGRVSPEQVVDNQPLLRHPGFRIGRIGVERNFDIELRGKPGALKYEVNALGRVIRELPDVRTRASTGKTIRLSLDRNLQNIAMQALDGTSGAACVLDVKTGEVTALVSTPSFDPNKFAKGISTKDYNALLADEYKPLFNKAIGGSYPPASCFKMVVAMAAFDAGLVDPKERIRCTGKIKLGDRIFHCWKRRGHGLIDLNSAIGVSCDTYFYELAKRLGIDRIHKAALKFGFGTNFDLDLGGGSSGLVPSQAWKRARFDLPWAQGETLIAGIGQGYLAATPIQLAVMTARIATGYDVKPTLQYQVPDQMVLQKELDFSNTALSIARKGMASVVNKPWGTAYTPAGIDGKNTLWAGKTGTGQVRRISQEERDTKVRKNKDLPWKLRDHALFVGYAPLDEPQFAISVVIEHGGSGSAEAAPRARKILKYAVEQRAALTNSENKNGEML